MTEELQAVKGMKDVLPKDIDVWHRVESVLRDIGRVYGYREIRTPIVEYTELFKQAIGDTTDIVGKEMYTFIDKASKNKAGKNLALRPEATASTVRSCIQHGLLHNQQHRLWYMGPMFRRERTQEGRTRQFHQFGVEAFGWESAEIDAEILLLGERIWKHLNIKNVKLQINTLGSPGIKGKYRDKLREYFKDHKAELHEDDVKRLENNPLRLLDSKNKETREIAAKAPDIRNFLDTKSKDHFDRICGLLRNSGIKYEINRRLVRGLDYYTSTVFEWVTDKDGAQNAICAGGRYDDLVENRGGKSTPGVGFALGMERLIKLLPEQNAADTGTGIHVMSKDEAVTSDMNKISERLRDRKFDVTMHCGNRKLAKKMKQAQENGANIIVILSHEDDRNVEVKGMNSTNTKFSPTESVSVDNLVQWCEKWYEPNSEFEKNGIRRTRKS